MQNNKEIKNEQKNNNRQIHILLQWLEYNDIEKKSLNELEFMMSQKWASKYTREKKSYQTNNERIIWATR